MCLCIKAPDPPVTFGAVVVRDVAAFPAGTPNFGRTGQVGPRLVPEETDTAPLRWSARATGLCGGRRCVLGARQVFRGLVAWFDKVSEGPPTCTLTNTTTLWARRQKFCAPTARVTFAAWGSTFAPTRLAQSHICRSRSRGDKGVQHGCRPLRAAVVVRSTA